MSKIRMKGKIIKCNETKGFGFIGGSNGKDIFFHTTDCKFKLSASLVGEEVEYKPSKDSKGRVCAIHVKLLNQKKSKLPAIINITLALGFTGFLCYAVSINRYPIEMIYLIAGLSVISVLAYGRDKSAALKGRWRVSENTLHTFSLLGGWPGAALAQTLFNHKTSKQPFRTVFWLTVFINAGFIGWTFTHNGEYFLYTHLLDFKQALREIAGNIR